MNVTSVSNGTRLLLISISLRSFGNFPESFGKWKTPSVSSGYPNTEKRVENTTRSGVFLTKFEAFG